MNTIYWSVATEKSLNIDKNFFTMIPNIPEQLLSVGSGTEYALYILQMAIIQNLCSFLNVLDVLMQLQTSHFLPNFNAD